jgi:hypothetical protein
MYSGADFKDVGVMLIIVLLLTFGLGFGVGYLVFGL